MVILTVLGTLLALAASLPIVRKWGLDLPKVVFGLAAAGLLSGLVVGGIRQLIVLGDVVTTLMVTATTLVLALGMLLQRFYRDPERRPPAQTDVVLSPADGQVIYVRRSEGGKLPVSSKKGRLYPLRELIGMSLDEEDATVIGIAMTFLDVHVNRAPIAGTVTSQRHFRGSFRSLREPEAVFENERASVVIDGSNLQVAVVQIASRLVRQIVSWTREGEALALGARIGMIRFGSQVDLVLPARTDVEISVQPGERVVAGETVVAVLTTRRDHR